MDKPTITPLPTPPNRQQGAAEFATRADAFLSALPDFGSEAQAAVDYIEYSIAASGQVASDVQAAASSAQSYAQGAQDSAQAAQGYAAQTAADRQAVEAAIVDGPVLAVNGKSGNVQLNAQDIGLPAGTGTNAVGNRTIGTGDPSGGANGDIHYKV